MGRDRKAVCGLGKRAWKVGKGELGKTKGQVDTKPAGCEHTATGISWADGLS
jgi:hypothetical protein